MGRTANDLVEAMRSFLGFSEYNRQYKQIIDIYNSHPPLARGYKVQYTDEWCDTTVSAAAIKAHMTEADTDTITAGAFRVTWKAVTSTRIDTAALRKELPEVWQEYSSERAC